MFARFAFADPVEWLLVDVWNSESAIQNKLRENVHRRTVREMQWDDSIFKSIVNLSR